MLKKMKRTNYSQEPTRLLIGRTFIMFRWGIERVAADGDESWTAYEIRIDAPVSADKVIKTVFDSYYGNDHENKLINEYNSAKMGVISGEEADKAVKAYGDFLTERASLKAEIEHLVLTAQKLGQI